MLRTDIPQKRPKVPPTLEIMPMMVVDAVLTTNSTVGDFTEMRSRLNLIPNLEICDLEIMAQLLLLNHFERGYCKICSQDVLWKVVSS